MYEISKQKKYLAGELTGVCINGTDTFVFSNKANKVFRVDSDLEVQESFDGLSYARFQRCLAMTIYGSDLYFALVNGEIWKKSMTTQSETKVLEIDAPTGLAIYDGNIYVFSQKDNKLSKLSLAGVEIISTYIPHSLKGIGIRDSDGAIYGVDQVTGKLYKIQEGTSGFSVDESFSGIYPFVSEYFTGDIDFSSGLISVQGDYLYKYDIAPYSFYKEVGGIWEETEIIEILNVDKGEEEQVHLKIVNTSASNFSHLTMNISSDDDVKGYVSYITLSPDDVTYASTLDLGILNAGAEKEFYVKFTVPTDSKEGAETLSLEISLN